MYIFINITGIIRTKLSRSIDIINKIKHKLTLKNRIQIYHSFLKVI